VNNSGFPLQTAVTAQIEQSRGWFDSGFTPTSPDSAEMDRIKHDAHQKLLAEDALGELAFFRLLRDAFTEFLESKPWLKAVGSDYWRGEDDDGCFGLRFEIVVDHPHVVDLEVTIKRGSN
jgi:hypothetical protein